jgi:hypothetical protein
MEREGSLRPPQGKERANGRNLDPVAFLPQTKTIFFKIYFSNTIQDMLVPSKLSLAFRFQHRSSSQSVQYIILSNLPSLIFGGKYTLRSSKLCTFLSPHVDIPLH